MIKILASFTSFLILTSCFSLLTSQGPETLPEGKMETGVTSVLIRGAGGNVEFSHGWFEPYFRFGLSSRTDLGIRGLVIIDMGKPIQNFIMVELKHQLNKKAPFFSTGIGASYFSYNADSTVCFYPTIWIGHTQFYGGARFLLLSSQKDSLNLEALPNVFIGSSIGKRFLIRPEISLYWSPDLESPFFVGGVGLSYRFGNKAP